MSRKDLIDMVKCQSVVRAEILYIVSITTANVRYFITIRFPE